MEENPWSNENGAQVRTQEEGNANGLISSAVHQSLFVFFSSLFFFPNYTFWHHSFKFHNFSSVISQLAIFGPKIRGNCSFTSSMFALVALWSQLATKLEKC